LGVLGTDLRLARQGGEAAAAPLICQSRQNGIAGLGNEGDDPTEPDVVEARNCPNISLGRTLGSAEAYDHIGVPLSGIVQIRPQQRTVASCLCHAVTFPQDCKVKINVILPDLSVIATPRLSGLSMSKGWLAKTPGGALTNLLLKSWVNGESDFHPAPNVSVPVE
jgi:hypothetical protein